MMVELIGEIVPSSFELVRPGPRSGREATERIAETGEVAAEGCVDDGIHCLVFGHFTPSYRCGGSRCGGPCGHLSTPHCPQSTKGCRDFELQPAMGCPPATHVSEGAMGGATGTHGSIG